MVFRNDIKLHVRQTSVPTLAYCLVGVPAILNHISLPVSFYCVYKANQSRNLTGGDQRSRFLVLTKRSAASGDENVNLF